MWISLKHRTMFLWRFWAAFLNVCAQSLGVLLAPPIPPHPFHPFPLTCLQSLLTLIPPPSHPTRDYWFTHNLLFNIREQTFQNLCNLSFSMCLSYRFVFASAERKTLFVEDQALIWNAVAVSSLTQKRWDFDEGNMLREKGILFFVFFLSLRSQATQAKTHPSFFMW